MSDEFAKKDNGFGGCLLVIAAIVLFGDLASHTMRIEKLRDQVQRLERRIGDLERVVSQGAR